MTYIPLPNPMPITYADSAFLDSFGRLRVSNPINQFAAFDEYKISPFNWVTSVTGTGTVTHSTTAKAKVLSTGGTAAGARAVLQSRYYMRYIPGKSLKTNETFVMGPAVVNCNKRVGYFDDNDGFFLELEGNGTINLVRRSSVSGSMVETKVPQASWNKDKLDGTGDSGHTLNLSYGQIFSIDLQFLGVGRVRCMFNINGQTVVAHEFLHANTNTGQPYMRTACLPIRFEIINTGVAASTASMDSICASVDSEGGVVEEGQQYSASNGAVGKSLTTTLTPIISVRPGPNFNGIVNRGWVIPQSLELFCTGNADIYYEIIWNATLTGPSWAAVNANAMGEVDTTATAVSLGGGVVMDSGYTSTSASKVGKDLTDLFSYRALVNDFAGTNPDTITLAARTITSTATGYGSVSWVGIW